MQHDNVFGHVCLSVFVCLCVCPVVLTLKSMTYEFHFWCAVCTYIFKISHIFKISRSCTYIKVIWSRSSNSLLYGINDGLLRCVQSVQNAAVRLVAGTRQCDLITPVLWQLHWLPVCQRIVLKITGLVHQSLAGVAPMYLADDYRQLSDIGH